MKERDIQTAFGKYLQSKESKFKENTYVFELKLINLKKKQTLKVSARNSKNLTVKKHQIKNLAKAKTGLYYKISDSPIFKNNPSRFTAPKPFDCIYIKARQSYVGIAFYEPRKLNDLYLLPVNLYKLFIKKVVNKLNRKSITYKIFLDFWEELYNSNVLNIVKVDLKPYFSNTLQD